MRETVFVDTDICLDLLTQRKPHYDAAAVLFTLADQKKIQICVSSLSFTNIHYILRHDNSVGESRKILGRFKVLTRVLGVDEKIVDLALQSDFRDFEDAVQYYTAIENKIKVLVTRNVKDFKTSAIPVMTAQDFVSTIS